jgi:TM2 domain-containing membrane protein YozV
LHKNTGQTVWHWDNELMTSVPPASTKYCYGCAANIDSRAEICPHCGVRQQGPPNPYPQQQIPQQQIPQQQYPQQQYPQQQYPQQQYPQQQYPAPVDPALQRAVGNKMVAGICGILIGALGIHKFLLGFTNAGVVMLLVTLLTCGFGAVPMAIIGLVEGIIYLTKSDQEFYQIYVVQRKEWF